MEIEAREKELSAADIVREREAYRYLDTKNIHAYVNNIEQSLPTARSCGESALTAFAQLGALRLNTQRAFVCLLDRTYCYTVAETTSSSKLRPNRHDEAEHGLLLCGIAVPHAFSLPSRILEAAIESLLLADESALLQLPVLVVSDLCKDSRFSSIPIVASEKSLRFCVAVPIKTHSGAFIGILYLTDDQPRTELNDLDTEFVRDLSKTIMDHLDTYRERQEFDRGTRMVRGLGSFVENRATMSGYSEDTQGGSFEENRGREGALNTLQQDSLRMTEREENKLDTRALNPRQTIQRSLTNSKDWFETPDPPTSQIEPSTKRQKKSSVDSWLDQDQPIVEPPLPLENNSGEGYGVASTSRKPAQTTTTSPPPPVDGLQKIFSRAANIIRESIEVEGVLFFDASVGYWGGLLESGKRDTSEGGSSTTSTTSTTSSSGDDDTLPTRSTIRTNTEETNCDVFGFSMTDGSSIDGKKASVGHLSVPERFLRILLRRYPMGKIFNFTADGRPVSDTETDEDPTRPTEPAQEAPPRIRRRKHHSYSRANEAALIISVFPGARSVLAFPLWDSHRERWFAGGVVWTCTPTRVFSVKGELSYLRAFGTVMMAEVARMDAQKADKSKATLLSSISHELRSPLHGILGGVEILQGTEIDVFQTNVTHSIETCGIMLLDTLEHLLTQSKINQSVRLAKLQRRDRRNNPKLNYPNEMTSGMLETSSNIEIDLVIEEVIESVFAGYEFMHLSRSPQKLATEDFKSSSIAARGLLGKQQVVSSSVLENIRVTLDMKPYVNWIFAVEAAALRRVVMNLFGNALKYITAGYIKVTVTQRELTKKRNAKTSEIKITFEDTGKGIGAEYLSNHLFKPFSQEDPLSQGTGLGLSITHQIVASLDGKIEVQSTVGRGTIMSVYLLLTRPEENTPSQGKFVEQRLQTKGLRVSLFGFYEDAGMTSDEVLKSDKGWQLPRSSIEMLCRDWLYMEVLAVNNTFTTPDVYIATVAGAQELAAMNMNGTIVQPVVVICPSAAIAHDLTKSAKTSDKFGVFEYISQPCGPRKLAKILTLCLDRWAAIQVEQAIQGPSPLHTGSPAPLHLTAPTSLKSKQSSSMSDGMASISPSPAISPQQSDLQPAQPSPPVKPATPRPSMAPILIVDDNDVNLKLLSAYLARKSIPFKTAVDGVFAVEAYKEARGNFSCIFMDIQMPRMDGIAATRKIREYEQEENLEAITVVALTGLATDEKQREAEASGINVFFAKPVRLKALDVILEQTARSAN